MRDAPALLADNRPPEDGLDREGRIARALEFHRRYGWSDDQILSHLLAIDFGQPVHEVGILPESRWESTGGHYWKSDGSTTCREPIPALQALDESGQLRIFIPEPFFHALDPAPPACPASFPRIQGADEFRLRLNEAKDATEKRLSENENDPTLTSILEQTVRIQVWIEKNEAPSPEDLRSLNLGPLTIQSHAAEDPAYAFLIQALHGASVRMCRLTPKRLLAV